MWNDKKLRTNAQISARHEKYDTVVKIYWC